MDHLFFLFASKFHFYPSAHSGESLTISPSFVRCRWESRWIRYHLWLPHRRRRLHGALESVLMMLIQFLPSPNNSVSKGMRILCIVWKLSFKDKHDNFLVSFLSFLPSCTRARQLSLRKRIKRSFFFRWYGNNFWCFFFVPRRWWRQRDDNLRVREGKCAEDEEESSSKLLAVFHVGWNWLHVNGNFPRNRFSFIFYFFGDFHSQCYIL